MIIALGIALIFGVIALGLLLIQQINSGTTASVPNNVNPSDIPERWQTISPMPTARYGFALANYDYKIYAISGQAETGLTGVVERYDTVSDQWESMASKPLPVRDISAAVVGGKIYVPGGASSDGVVYKSLEIYDPGTNKWTTVKDLPTAVRAYAWIAFEGKIYLFGGWDGGKFVADVYEYLPTLGARCCRRQRRCALRAAGVRGGAVSRGMMRR